MSNVVRVIETAFEDDSIIGEASIQGMLWVTSSLKMIFYENKNILIKIFLFGDIFGDFSVQFFHCYQRLKWRLAIITLR